MSIELEIRSDSRQARQDLGQLNKQLGQIQENTARQADTFRNLGRAAQIAAAGIGTLFAGNALTRSGDTLRRINTQLKLVTDSTEAFTKAQRDLNRIAISTRKDTEQLATVYNRLSRSAKTLGKSQDDIAKATKAIAQSIEISGASAESANAAIIQLGQGLSSGQLRGEELNSVLEQAPRLAQAIADELKITTGELRNVAKEGKLTSDVVFTALLNQAQKINSEFAQVDLTVSSAGQVFSTGATNFLAAIDQSLGLSESLANNLQAAGIALNNASQGVGDFAAVAEARFALLRTDVEQMVAGLTDVSFNFSAEAALNTLNEVSTAISHIADNNELFDAEDLAFVKRELDIIAIMIRGMIRDAKLELGLEVEKPKLEAILAVVQTLKKEADSITLDNVTQQAAVLEEAVKGLDLSALDGVKIDTKQVTDAVIDGLNDISPEDARSFGEVVGTGLSLGLPKTFTIATNSAFFSQFSEGLQTAFDGLNVTNLVNNIGAGLEGALTSVVNAIPGSAAVGEFFESPIFNSIDASLEAINKVVTGAFGGLTTGQLSGLILALQTFTSSGQALGRPGQNIGQAAVDPFLQRQLDKRITSLKAEAVALESISNVDLGFLRDYNDSLAKQAEIGTKVNKVNGQINELFSRRATLNEREKIQLTSLIAQRRSLTVGLNKADAAVQKQLQATQKLGLSATDADRRLRALDTTIKSLSNIRDESGARSVNRQQETITAFGNTSGLIGGAVGGAIGFEIGSNFVQIIEDTMFDLPGWAEVGVTIGTSILGQITGTAIATALGTALGTLMVPAIGAALAAISLPVLGIGALLVGGVALAVYFKDELLFAFQAVAEFFKANVINPIREAFGLDSLEEVAARRGAASEVLAPTVAKLVPIVDDLRSQRGSANFGLGGVLGNLTRVIEQGGFRSDRQAELQGQQLDKVIENAKISQEQKSVLIEIRNAIRDGNLTQGSVQAFATGGYVRGPGTGTSDDITARLSNGEYVINAAATRKHKGLLDSINNGGLPGFATGGIVDILELNEGRRNTPYVDTRGHVTVGIGHKLTKSELRALGLSTEAGAYTNETLAAFLKGRTTFTDDYINQLFQQDLAKAITDAKSLVNNYDGLPGAAQNVLTDMAFNMGRGRLSGFKNMLAAINKGDFNTAADELLDSRYANQVGDRAVRNANALRGLVTGSGSTTSDSILARVSNGEYIVNAASTKLFKPLLDLINSGSLPKFRNGGQVGGGSGGGFLQALAGFNLNDFSDQEVLTTLKMIDERLRDQSLTEVQRTRLEEQGVKLSERIKSELEDLNDAAAGGGQGGQTFDETRTGELIIDTLSSDIATALSKSEFDNIGQIVRAGVLSSIQKASQESLKENLTTIFTKVFSSIEVPSFGGGGGSNILGSIISGGMSYFGFNQGGVVPHMPGVGDRVPAMLEPGELVVPKKKYKDVVGDGNNKGTQIVNINISGNVDQRAIDQIRQVIVASPKEVGSANQTFGSNTKGLRRS